MSLVLNIQRLCDTKEMTITKLEKELGFGRSSIYKWDKNSPSIDKVQKVADFFNVSIDHLLGRDHLQDIEISKRIADDLYPILFDKLKEMDLPQELKDAAVTKFSTLSEERKLALLPKLVKSVTVQDGKIKYAVNSSDAPSIDEVIDKYKSLPDHHRKALADIIQDLSKIHQ